MAAKQEDKTQAKDAKGGAAKDTKDEKKEKDPKKAQPDAKADKGAKTDKADKGAAGDKEKQEGAEVAEGDKAKVLQKGLAFLKAGGVFYVILGLNFIVASVVFSYVYYLKFVYKKPTITDTMAMEEVKQKAEEMVEIIEYKLEPFVVNLSKHDKNKYLNARFTLIALDFDTKNELDKKVDKIRDAIISILNEKSAGEISTVQGKLFLKDQIVTSINRILLRGSVKEVYIESFVVQ
jgi:flagellar basal body-associated protein FliL